MILRHRRRRAGHRPVATAFPVALGGGWWCLSDGSKVQGAAAAAAAQDALSG